jgi:hypothetical protein
MINKVHTANFQTLIRAVINGDVVLMECTDAATGDPVVAICAVERDGDTFELKPLAKLFNGNPYEELIPPAMEEEA